jgi:hypothetical protein
MKRIIALTSLALLLVGCAGDATVRSTLPPDIGQTGIGGPGSGAGMSGIGVDRQRTTGTGTTTNEPGRLKL